MKKQAAIVILNWNGRKLLEQFLPLLLQHTPADEADIIVCDNGSTDDSVAFLKSEYPHVILQILDINYGFADGYNRALSGLKYKYVVLLNSDVEVSPGWFRLAVDYLETHPEVSALQPKILSYKDKSQFEYAGACGGFLDKHGYPFCRGRILNTLETDGGQYDLPVPIFWASGACLFIRLADYQAAGGLDARFFAHQEEIDLCWRLHAQEKKIVCLPQSLVYHVGGATLTKEQPQKTYLNFRNNLLMLYKNLPNSQYSKVMFVRFFWDYLSALHFLFQGQFCNALAVMRARKDFHHLKSTYKLVRQKNLAISHGKLPETIFQKSILWEYYFKNRKKYTDLEIKFLFFPEKIVPLSTFSEKDG